MRSPRQLFQAIFCFALALLAGGCVSATNALWQRQAYHPASPPAIKLALDPHRQDILVRYKEQVNWSSHVQEKAYWLFASTNSSTGTPVFVADSDLTSSNELVNVPVYRSKKELRRSSAQGYGALNLTGLNDFELWRDAKKLQTYELPTYSHHAAATPWRVALTPLSATGDAVLTASAVAVAIPAGAVYAVVYMGKSGAWSGIPIPP